MRCASCAIFCSPCTIYKIATMQLCFTRPPTAKGEQLHCTLRDRQCNSQIGEQVSRLANVAQHCGGVKCAPSIAYKFGLNFELRNIISRNRNQLLIDDFATDKRKPWRPMTTAWTMPSDTWSHRGAITVTRHQRNRIDCIGNAGHVWTRIRCSDCIKIGY